MRARASNNVQSLLPTAFLLGPRTMNPTPCSLAKKISLAHQAINLLSLSTFQRFINYNTVKYRRQSP